MLDNSTREGEAFAGRIATKVGDKLTGLRDVSTAVATALGLNLNNIAEQTARFLTGVSKEMEESLKRIADLSKENADATLAAIERRATAEQNYQRNLDQSARLVREIAEQEAKRITETEAYNKALKETGLHEAAIAAAVQARTDNTRALLAIEEKTKALREVRNKIEAEEDKRKAEAMKRETDFYKAVDKFEADIAEAKKKNAAEEIEAKEKLDKLLTSEMSLDGQINKLWSEIVTANQEYVKKLAEGSATTADQVKLLEQQRDLNALIEKSEKAQLTAAKEKAEALAKQNEQFQTQLDKIKQMAGVGRGTFEVNERGGGEPTITVPELENALSNARGAMEDARRKLNTSTNQKQALENFRQAETLFNTLTDSLRVAKMTGGGVMAGQYGAIPISSLNLGALGLGSSGPAVAVQDSATLQAVRQNTKVTAQVLKNVDDALSGFFGDLDSKSKTMVVPKPTEEPT